MSPLTAYVVETTVTLLGVVALAVLVLYAARRLGVGSPGGPIDLVGRLPLDGRRAVYLVRVGETVYVVGASEAGMTKLGEHHRDGFDTGEVPSGRMTFGDALQRVLRRPSGAAPRQTPSSEVESRTPPETPRG